MRIEKATRVWGWAAALIIAFGAVLSGCGNSDMSPSDSASASGDVSTAPSAAPESVELIVSAAVSLTESLNEIKKIYEAKNSDVKLIYNFGASGTLQHQIEQGAPADLFLSAGRKQMEALVEKQLIEAGTNRNLLGNELVVITNSESNLSIAQLQDLLNAAIKKLGVGAPESVPAGSYSKEALTSAGIWDTLQSKMVFTKDVKQVLTYVETGNTEAGFVYKTDALTSRKVKIAYTFDRLSYKPIEYPVGIVKATKHKPEAERFYQYLRSKEAMNIFIKYGFTLPK
jgi:molybdate transport system substrate-binding protein